MWSEGSDEPGNGHGVCLLLSDHVKVRDFGTNLLQEAVLQQPRTLLPCDSGTVLYALKMIEVLVTASEWSVLAVEWC